MKTLSIKEKSVHINIDSNYYGTVAEIGGGQETARHLFQAGGASNTVAKTISAYDKLFSDHFYNQGQSSRYVAEERVKKMVECEYAELLKILDKKNEQKFFAFANTVETLNYHKTNSGHGWLGIAVEGSERYKPNYIFIHVKLLENDALLQQYTLGALGINLLHGGLFMWADPRKILTSLLDNLDNDRVEVDYIFVDGPDMQWVDNRLLNLLLVKNDMTPAIMFDKDGHVQQPGDMLYKKNVLVVRGFFRPINKLGMDFIEDSLEMFKHDENYEPSNTIAFCEISLNYLMQDAKLDEKDFLHRVDLLNLMGQSVMVSKFNRFFHLVDYFAQFKMIKLRIVVGLPTFEKILDSSYYKDLRGGVLEAMGALFQENVKLYLYPSLDTKTGNVIFPEDIKYPPATQCIWDYLLHMRRVVTLREVSVKHLGITTELVTKLIETGDEKLCDYLPEKVMDEIVRKELFGYKGKSC